MNADERRWKLQPDSAVALRAQSQADWTSPALVFIWFVLESLFTTECFLPSCFPYSKTEMNERPDVELVAVLAAVHHMLVISHDTDIELHAAAPGVRIKIRERARPG